MQACRPNPLEGKRFAVAAPPPDAKIWSVDKINRGSTKREKHKLWLQHPPTNTAITKTKKNNLRYKYRVEYIVEINLWVR